MVSALIVRRFKTGGMPPAVEAARLMDLPALPCHGYLLVFEDGTGEAGVAGMRMRAWPSPRAPGIYPIGIELRTGMEPGERLEAAVAAGWQPLAPSLG